MKDRLTMSVILLFAGGITGVLIHAWIMNLEAHARLDSVEPAKPVQDPNVWKKAYLGKLFRIGDTKGTVAGFEGLYETGRARVVLQNGDSVYVEWMAVANQHGPAVQP